jgi:phage baseplate assembly protein W
MSNTYNRQAYFIGTGWSFPPTFEKGSYELKLTDNVENINQSIDLIFKTARGERCLLPSYGSNLRSFVYRNVNATLKEEISQSVKKTLLNDEPRIRVDKVDVVNHADLAATISLSINYTIKNTNTRHNHVFPFSMKEGTNLLVNHDGIASN